MMNANKRILIAGYYGFDNLGDELILKAMLSDLRMLRPNTHFVVTSYAPEKTRAMYNVDAIDIYDIAMTLDAIQHCDLVLVGGGGVFNEYTKWQSDSIFTIHPDVNVFCAAIPVLAAACGKSCMIYAFGVEPLYSLPAREDVANAFALATEATVRDSGSLNVLTSIGAPTQKIKVTADPVFRISILQPSTTELLERHGIGEKGPILGVQLIHWNLDRWDWKEYPNTWEIEVAKALDLFVEENGGMLIFISFQHSPERGYFGDDMPVLQRVKQLMRNSTKVVVFEGSQSADTIMSVIAGCDLFLGMRFHSTVLAQKLSIPLVAVCYSLKVKNSMDRMGLAEFAFELKNVKADSLLAALEKAYREREQITSRLKQKTKEMEDLALQNAEIAVRLLDDENARKAHLTTDFERVAAGLMQKYINCLAKQEKELEVLRTEHNVLHAYLRDLIDRQRRHDTAEILLQSLLEVNPNHAEWNYLFAFCLQSQKKAPEKAIRHYDVALEKGFHEFWIRYNRGILYKNMGNIEKAKTDLMRANTLDPEHPELRKTIEELS